MIINNEKYWDLQSEIAFARRDIAFARIATKGNIMDAEKTIKGALDECIRILRELTEGLNEMNKRITELEQKEDKKDENHKG